jgi:ribonucleoside-triphosphate reductase
MKINGTIKTVQKRNGRLVPFEAEKITFAVFKALRAIGDPNRDLAQKVTDNVVSKLSFKTLTVEEIQDLVEFELFDQKQFRVAKAYIIYRKQHDGIRNVKELFSNIDIVDDYINNNDWRIKESANSTYSLQGMNQHISTIISSQYWLNKIYPTEIGNAHKQGKLHIHDLGFLSVYCVGWDLQELIMVGFKGVPCKVESKPAKHFRTLLGQIVNFFYTMQGEAAGAQAFSNFDTYLAPFIRQDKLSYKEVKQALQEFMFNMNIPTRVGFQTPFTNITLDLVIPNNMKNTAIIIGGELQNSTYGNYQHEMDIFNKAFAEVMTEGDANGRIFSFPIPTYNITKDFDWDNESRQPIWDMTAKYGIPYFSNFVNSDMSPDDVRSMCCRLRLDTTKLKSRGGGLFGANPLTGSVGVVTLNLPRVGYEAKTKEELFQRIEKLMILAKESLEIKRKVIENLTENGLYPYSKFYLRHIREKNGTYWGNHFSTIGLVGMNELLLNFYGYDITSKAGNKCAEEIMIFMRNKLQEFQDETEHIYNLEATPAEGTTYRLAQIDKVEFPDIITANEKQVKENEVAPYYTNSSQLPVGYTDDIFEALELQDNLQTKYTGGTVFHTFIGESQLSPESIKRLVKMVCSNFKLPYFTLSPTFSVCSEHGYIYGEHKHCPKCEAKGKVNKCEVYSRIVGYLRPVDQWNDGKQSEFSDRKLFDKKIKEEKEVEDNVLVEKY